MLAPRGRGLPLHHHRIPSDQTAPQPPRRSRGDFLPRRSSSAWRGGRAGAEPTGTALWPPTPSGGRDSGDQNPETPVPERGLFGPPLRPRLNSCRFRFVFGEISPAMRRITRVAAGALVASHARKSERRMTWEMFHPFSRQSTCQITAPKKSSAAPTRTFSTPRPGTTAMVHRRGAAGSPSGLSLRAAARQAPRARAAAAPGRGGAGEEPGEEEELVRCAPPRGGGRARAPRRGGRRARRQAGAVGDAPGVRAPEAERGRRARPASGAWRGGRGGRGVGGAWGRRPGRPGTRTPLKT